MRHYHRDTTQHETTDHTRHNNGCRAFQRYTMWWYCLPHLDLLRAAAAEFADRTSVPRTLLVFEWVAHAAAAAGPVAVAAGPETVGDTLTRRTARDNGHARVDAVLAAIVAPVAQSNASDALIAAACTRRALFPRRVTGHTLVASVAVGRDTLPRRLARHDVPTFFAILGARIARAADAIVALISRCVDSGTSLGALSRAGRTRAAESFPETILWIAGSAISEQVLAKGWRGAKGRQAWLYLEAVLPTGATDGIARHRSVLGNRNFGTNLVRRAKQPINGFLHRPFPKLFLETDLAPPVRRRLFASPPPVAPLVPFPMSTSMRCLAMVVLASAGTARAQDANDKLTIWEDESIDMLSCVQNKCSRPLTACELDEGCTQFLECGSECELSDIPCIWGACKSVAAEAAVLYPNAFRKVGMLSGCVVSHCPNTTASDEEAGEDIECEASLEPLVTQMNSVQIDSSTDKDVCFRKLAVIVNALNATRTLCEDELNVIYSMMRNYVHFHQHRHPRCPAFWKRLQKRLKAVLADARGDEQDEESTGERIHEKTGESILCRNRDYDGVPWQDSDGDGCGVYVAYRLCRDGKLGPGVTQHNIDTGCVSRDCRGLGGDQATKACCACGGGRAPTPDDAPDPEEMTQKAKILFRQRCMLSYCMPKLVECHSDEGCRRGLDCVSNTPCVPGSDTTRSCRDRCAEGLSSNAKSFLLEVMECAGTEHSKCFQDERAAIDSGRSSGSGGSNKSSSTGAIVGVSVTLGVLAFAAAGFMFYRYTKNNHDFTMLNGEELERELTLEQEVEVDVTADEPEL